jgi:hypothetical protein
MTRWCYRQKTEAGVCNFVGWQLAADKLMTETLWNAQKKLEQAKQLTFAIVQ